MPWQPTFTLACIRVVYINKFVAGHENLFYRKYSLEKKKLLITNAKREIDICLRTQFDNRITPWLSQKSYLLAAEVSSASRAGNKNHVCQGRLCFCRIKIGIKSTLNQKADS